jgi:hypothetical protein
MPLSANVSRDGCYRSATRRGASQRGIESVKTIVLLSIGLLVPIVALATSTQPAPTGNVATLVQINVCEEECDSISQVNTAIVIQDIRPGDALAYVPSETKPEFPRAELANMVTIVQENFCVDCCGVDQRNIALVIQNINPDTVAMLRGVAPAAGLNTVEITQINTCLDCTEALTSDEQEKVAIIIQNIRPEDYYLYSPKMTDLGRSLELVIQNINPDDVILIPK